MVNSWHRPCFYLCHDGDNEGAGKRKKGQAMQDNQTQILDFVSYRKKTVAKKALRTKVQTQAYEMLKVVQGLVFDYEAQMLAIAQEVAGDGWVEKHGRSPVSKSVICRRNRSSIPPRTYAAMSKKASPIPSLC